MKFSVQQIATYLNAEIEGDSSLLISGISKIEDGEEGTLTFLSNPQYTKYIYSTKATAVLISKSVELTNEVHTTLIKVDDAYESFASLLQLYAESLPKKVGVEEFSFISKSATYGSQCYIGSFAYIGDNVVLGDNVKIYPHAYIGDNSVINDNTIIYSGVKIYQDSKVGCDCVIHSGAVIGADGFGFAPQDNDNYKKIPQIGNVIIEDYVEIGANTAIDRATMGSTIIRKGVKLDNLIQVAHNVEIGENTVVAAQTGIAGSVKIGKFCMFGGQVGISGHIKVGDRVRMAAKSGISVDTAADSVLQGAPAFPFTAYQKSYVLFKSLPTLNSRINSLEKEIKSLKSNL